MPRNKSGSSNGGVIGKTNATSFGGDHEHKFTSPGTFSPSGPSSGTRLLDVVVVAGGAGGGATKGSPNNNAGGGGGAGGVLYLRSFPYSPSEGNKSVTIGGGGAGVGSLSQSNSISGS
jgi:hypothetical protein